MSIWTMPRLGRSLVLLATLSSGVLVGCATLPPEAKVDAAAQVAVTPAGKDAVGDDCSYEPASMDDVTVTATRSYNVHCGTWKSPSGRVFEANDYGGTDQLRQAAQGSGWRTYLNQRVACADPTTGSLLDQPAVLLQCTRRNGGWPHLAFATTIGNKTFLADGVPSAAPALQATVAALSGRPLASVQESGALTQLRTAGISAQAFGSGDLDRYYSLLKQGNDDNSVENFAAAESAFRDALAVQQRILGSENPGLAVPLMHLALQISNQQRFVEADRLFERASSYVAKTSDPMVRASLDYYLALHLSNEDKTEEAEKLAVRAEQGFSRFVPKPLLQPARQRLGAARGAAGAGVRAAGFADALVLDPETQQGVSGLAGVLRLRSTLSYDRAKYDAADDYATRARGLLDASGLNPTGSIPRAIRLAAASAAASGNFASADRSYGEAVRLFDRETPGQRPVAVTLFASGRELAENGQTEDAIARFRTGAKILRERHLGLPEQLVTPYMEALFVSAQRPKTPALDAEMFEASQLVRSSFTAQLIAQATVRLSSGDPRVGAALRQLQDQDLELKQLFADRDAEAGKPAAFRSAEQIAKIDGLITAAQTKRADAEAAAQSAAPVYGQLVQADAPADAVRAVLRPNEGMIVITLGDKRSYGFLLTRTFVKPYRIDLTTKQAATAVDHLRQTAQLQSDGKGGVTLPPFDVQAAHDLYDKLLGPVAADLAKLSYLVISPSGSLLSLPFEMLVTEKIAPVADDYRKVPFLLRKFAIDYVPAPTTFLGLRRIKASASGAQPYIGFGDPQLPTAAQLAVTFPPDRCKSDYQGIRDLPTLPETREEIIETAKLLRAPASDIVLGDKFTKKQVLAQDLRQFRVVHFATHALLPSELHCRSEPSILMTVPASAPDASQAFLDSSEVLRLQMDADLVVLSACNTAGPSGSDAAGAGEALSGLARAFFFAGSRGIMVTHWQVEDNSAKIITTRTIEAMSHPDKPVETAVALRTAKLNLIDNAAGNALIFTHPFAWAPFVLIGDGLLVRGAATTTASAAAPPAEVPPAN